MHSDTDTSHVRTVDALRLTPEGEIARALLDPFPEGRKRLTAAEKAVLVADAVVSFKATVARMRGESTEGLERERASWEQHAASQVPVLAAFKTEGGIRSYMRTRLWPEMRCEAVVDFARRVARPEYNLRRFGVSEALTFLHDLTATVEGPSGGEDVTIALHLHGVRVATAVMPKGAAEREKDPRMLALGFADFLDGLPHLSPETVETARSVLRGRVE